MRTFQILNLILIGSLVCTSAFAGRGKRGKRDGFTLPMPEETESDRDMIWLEINFTLGSDDLPVDWQIDCASTSQGAVTTSGGVTLSGIAAASDQSGIKLSKPALLEEGRCYRSIELTVNDHVVRYTADNYSRQLLGVPRELGEITITFPEVIEGEDWLYYRPDNQPVVFDESSVEPGVQPEIGVAYEPMARATFAEALNPELLEAEAFAHDISGSCQSYFVRPGDYSLAGLPPEGYRIEIAPSYKSYVDNPSNPHGRADRSSVVVKATSSMPLLTLKQAYDYFFWARPDDESVIIMPSHCR